MGWFAVKPMDPQRIPIIVTHQESARTRTHAHEPITLGVPFPMGMLRDVAGLAVSDEQGRLVLSQATLAERWADGSVRWAHVDFQCAGRPATRTFHLLELAPGAVPATETPLQVRASQDEILVDTRAARFRMICGASHIFEEVIGAAVPAAGPIGALRLVGEDGREWTARIARVSVERQGPVHCEVRLDGTVGPPRDPSAEVSIRVRFYAGSATTRVSITLRNPRAASHPGGFWELGSDGSIYMREVSVRFALPAPAQQIEFTAKDADPQVVDGRIAIHQAGSGGEQWQSVTHVNRHGRLSARARGFTMSGAIQAEGLRATPCAVLSNGPKRLGLAAAQFWQNFPKALDADRDGLTLGLWPRVGDELHELQGGEQKTHEFVLIAGDDALSRDAHVWGRWPARAATTPAWYCEAAAVPHLRPRTHDVDDRYARLVGEALDGEDSFMAKRERIDEFGWRHFGDIYADHENAFSDGGGEPIVSHYNNQYDAIAGCATQFFRTADPRWWELMDDAAKHVADIDIYHTDRDKPAYNHGLFWHTFHYVPAGRSSHRSYPRHPKVWGGGPANEHNYAAGLRLHWLLTGSAISRDAALELAEWVIAMDDGRRTILRWLSTAPTGLASATQSPDYHGPGRGAGHSILALLEGHRLTGDARFLRKAEELIHRCIHPSDDVAGRRLLDVELRWSYVVFLQALGKYLDHKETLGQGNDADASYARASLVHYARWMAEHEYPYLQKPEVLEYPTETWAAQDLRKSEVFLYAARVTGNGERDRFLERARFFFDESVATLAASPTRALARPLVLLLSNGYMFAGFVPLVAAGTEQMRRELFLPPRTFVRQKTVAKRRLVGAAAVFVTVFVLTVIAAVL